MISSKELAKRLLEYDTDKKCPYCSKESWGEEKHDKECPFAMAYKVVKQSHPKREEAEKAEK